MKTDKIRRIFSQKTFTVKEAIIIIGKQVLLLKRINKQVFQEEHKTKTASTVW